MIITDEKTQQSLDYLASTDEKLAKLKARMKGLDHAIKVLKADIFLQEKGKGTDSDRKAKAEVHSDVISMYEELHDAFADVEIIEAKRKRAELNIEVWRTEQANRRKGNI